MKKIAILGTLIVAMLQSALAIQVDVSTSWVDGQQVYPLKATDLTYIADHGKDYTRTLYNDNPSSFYARVLPGHEITQWSWGTSACMPDADKYPNVLMSSSAALPWQSNWNYLSASVSTVYLGVHQSWFKYTISFDSNGGNNSMDVMSGLAYNVQRTLSANAFTKTGYDMIGWTRDKGSNTVEFDDKATVTGASFGLDYLHKSVTLYAVWKAKTVTLTLDPQGGTLSAKTQSVTYDQVLGEFPTPIRKGYTFKGWFTAKTGGTQLKEDTVSQYTSSATVYAQWSVDSYKISFIANAPIEESSGSMSDQTLLMDEQVHKLSRNYFSRTGHTFLGWSKDKSATEPTYEDEAILSVPLTYETGATIVFYAVWQPNTYTITFNPNGEGATVKPETKTVTYGSTYGELPTPSRAENSFMGWYTSTYGGDKIESNTKVTITANQTLHARWTSLSKTITYNLDGGRNPEGAPASYVEGVGATLPIPTRTGYVFKGWYTDAALTSAVQTAIDQEAKGNKTFYARWRVKYTALTLNANGGELAKADSVRILEYNKKYQNVPNIYPTHRDDFSDLYLVSVNDGVFTTDELGRGSTAYYTVKALGFLPSNATFTYKAIVRSAGTGSYSNWEDGDGQLGGEVDGSGTFDVLANENQTIYSKANVQTPECALDGSITAGRNGLSGFSFSVELSCGTNGVGLAALPTPTRTGWAFDGWYTESEGGTRISDTTTVNADPATTLYAHWRSTTFKVTFDPRSGSVDPTTKNVIVGQTYGDLPTPSREGYSFDGWYTNTSAGEKIVSTTTVDKSYEHTLYAHWTAKTYTVIFDSTGGSSCSSQTVTYDESYSGKLPTPEKTGYTFTGWYTAAEGGAQVTTSMTVKITADQTLYAHWKANEYTVNFYSNGGSNCPQQTVTYAATYEGKLPTTTRPGYTFMGWFTEDKDGTQVTASTSVTTAGNHNLFARWSANGYTINFNANGGDDPNPATKDVICDDKYGTLAVTARTGWTFDGWYTVPEGGARIYETTTVGADPATTLYAHWTVNKYRITVQKSGEGSGSVSPSGTTSYAYGSTVTLTATASTGSEFVQWSDGVTTPERTITVGTSDMTYTAEFKLKTFTVRFDPGVGTVSPTSKTVTYSKSYGELPKPVWTGHTFVEWQTQGGSRVTADDTVKLDGNITLTAKYAVETYMVQVVRNTASEGSGSVSGGGRYEYGKTVTIQANADVGSKFTQWSDGNRNASREITVTNDVTYTASFELEQYSVKFIYYNAQGEQITDSQNIKYGRAATPPADSVVDQYPKHHFTGWGNNSYGTVRVNMEVQALYEWDSYSIRFNINAPGGGSGSMSVQTLKMDAPHPLSRNNFSRTGHKFLGWSPDKSATAPMYNDEESVNALTDERDKTVDLYAVWQANTYMVSFDGNGGTETAAIQQTYGTKYKLPATNPTRTGYTFVGWFTTATGTTEVTTSTNVETTRDHILYAHWQPYTCSVSFDGNGGSSTADISQTYGTYYNLPDTDPARTGYGFDGWYTAATDGSRVTTSTIVETTSDHTLYAHWTANRYTVSFDSNHGSYCAPQKVTYGGTYEGILPTPTKDGNKFVGWYTEAEGGTKVEASTKVTITDDQTLYAHWSKEVYTIRFNGGEGTIGEMNNQVIGYVDNNVDLTLNTFTKTGYTFEAWAKSEEDAKKHIVAYQDGERMKAKAYPVDSIVDLYATWSNNTYTVRFYANGGTGEMAEQSFTYDEDPKALLTNGFERVECEFIGWATDPEEDACFTDEEMVSNLTDKNDDIVMLFAKWRRIDSYDSDLSKWADCAETVLGKYKALDLKNKQGMISAKKSEDAIVGESSVMLAPGERSKTSTMTCDRICGPGTLTFYYKTVINNKVSNGFDFTATINGEQKNLLESSSVQDWQQYTLTVKAGEELTELEWAVNIGGKLNITDYALVDGVFWKPESWDTETVALTYRLNDGTVAPKDIITNVTCKVGAAIGALPVAKSAGREFLGWATDAKASAADVNEDWLVPAADTQLYAVWKTGANPEPTEGDRPVIGEGFKFMTDARFDYVIRMTTDLTVAPDKWVQYKVIKGTGDAVALPIPPFGDAAGETLGGTGSGARFFKVEVIQRK